MQAYFIRKKTKQRSRAAKLQHTLFQEGNNQYPVIKNLFPSQICPEKCSLAVSTGVAVCCFSQENESRGLKGPSNRLNATSGRFFTCAVARGCCQGARKSWGRACRVIQVRNLTTVSNLHVKYGWARTRAADVSPQKRSSPWLISRLRSDATSGVRVGEQGRAPSSAPPAPSATASLEPQRDHQPSSLSGSRYQSSSLPPPRRQQFQQDPGILFSPS